MKIDELSMPREVAQAYDVACIQYLYAHHCCRCAHRKTDDTEFHRICSRYRPHKGGWDCMGFAAGKDGDTTI